MAMKEVIYALMMAGALLTSGCNKDEDMLTKQKDAIVRYLTSSRKMVAEQEVGNVIEGAALLVEHPCSDFGD